MKIKNLLNLFMILALASQAVAGGETLFPTNQQSKKWATFEAQGFSKPVCGVTYRTTVDNLRDGMPLGAIDTGCIDLEQDCTFSFNTIFNSHVPRRGPMGLPFLGMSIGGQTWLLCAPDTNRAWVACTPDQPDDFKKFTGREMSKYPPPPEPVFTLEKDKIQVADEIMYWGHYPVADLEFETTAPVKVGLRAWSPFIPGDLKRSIIPGMVFELHLRNSTGAEQKATLAFSFPGPLDLESGSKDYARSEVKGAFNGIEVTAPLASYTIGTVGEENLRFGRDLDSGTAWSQIHAQLPAAGANHAGASVAADVTLAGGESKVLRFILAWSAPTWNADGYNWSDPKLNHFTHMYDKYYPKASSTAELLANNHAALLKKILAWQQVVYTDSSMPVWLRETLVNGLHMITEVGMWAQAKSPLPDWVKPEDGLFGMNECPRQCPQIECIPCSFYGNIPLVYFYPELALSTLRGYKGYQYKDDGRPPWIFGGTTGGTPFYDFANPTKGYQFVLNGSCYAEMFNKMWLRQGKGKTLLKEFYESLKHATDFTMSLRPEYGAKQVVSMPTGNGGDEWFESTAFYGMCSHVGGIHLAHLQMAKAWAQAMGDTDYERKCDELIKGGSEAMETDLWAGTHYYLYNEPETGKKSDVVMGYQMDGEWISWLHGFEGVLDRKHARTTLDTLSRINANPDVCDYGALLFANADGGLVTNHTVGYWTRTGTHLPSVLMLGMTYMYHGQEKKGLEVCYRALDNMIRRQSAGWDWGIVYNPSRPYESGSDYYQDMVIWSLPAALARQDITGPTKPGGLVDRMIKATQ